MTDRPDPTRVIRERELIDWLCAECAAPWPVDGDRCARCGYRTRARGVVGQFGAPRGGLRFMRPPGIEGEFEIIDDPPPRRMPAWRRRHNRQAILRWFRGLRR